MKFNITLKKVICFLLAVLMLLGTTACSKGKKKPLKSNDFRGFLVEMQIMIRFQKVSLLIAMVSF